MVRLAVTAEPRVHLDDGKWGRCGVALSKPHIRITRKLGEVTCRSCRRRGEEDYASRRDGIDYRRQRFEERRELAADRAAAARIVIQRHREEYEMELALLRLAR